MDLVRVVMVSIVYKVSFHSTATMALQADDLASAR